MPPIIEVRELSKLYQLGQIGARSLRDSVGRWWDTLRGRPHRVQHDEASHPEIDPERAGPVPNSFWALRDVSFDVEQGEVLGIIGRNGAGKSTLLKILSRITEPTHGYAKLRGRVASLLEVGTGFHDELTGRENVFLNGTILGLKKREIDQRLDEIVDFSGVEKFLDTPVKRYSSGMRVRLAFAVAAHLDPEILIIDEVLAVGDAEFQEKCIGKIRSLREISGKTALFVSHSLPTVYALCTRAAIFEGGRLVKMGVPQEMVNQYLNGMAAKDGLATFSKWTRGSAAGAVAIAMQSIVVESREGKEKQEYRWDEAINIRMQMKRQRQVDDPVLGFFIADQRGRRIFTSNCPDFRDRWQAGDDAGIIVGIPGGFLVPGTYTASFVITASRTSVIDSVLEAVTFIIQNEGSEFQEFDGQDYGCVFAACQWS